MPIASAVSGQGRLARGNPPRPEPAPQQCWVSNPPLLHQETIEVILANKQAHFPTGCDQPVSWYLWEDRSHGCQVAFVQGSHDTFNAVGGHQDRPAPDVD
jgi:hypothetical protein